MGTRELSVDVKDLMAEIKAQYDAKLIPPEDTFTVRQFAEEIGISESSAKRVLATALENGTLTRERWPLPHGGTKYLYRRTDGRGRKEELHSD
jgi:predicted transcriptional regulator